jgi:hypothetical protein
MEGDLIENIQKSVAEDKIDFVGNRRSHGLGCCFVGSNSGMSLSG